MLVTQCPSETPGWNFQPSTKDGTLDVLAAIMEQVIADNPIDENRITVTGVSSGGYGVWKLLEEKPDLFAGAVPTSCATPSHIKKLESLKQTRIWSFVNKGDVSPESTRITMQKINDSGGSMALTECDAPGHNAWRPAMEDYNCFRWMLAQKRGSPLTPPPGAIVHASNPPLLVFAVYLLPFSIIVFLLWRAVSRRDED